jgi:hypothetical protein
VPIGLSGSRINRDLQGRLEPRPWRSLGPPLRKLKGDTALAFAEKVLAAAKTDQAQARGEELKQKAAAKAAGLQRQLDTAEANAKSKLDAAAPDRTRRGKPETARAQKAVARRLARRRAATTAYGAATGVRTLRRTFRLCRSVPFRTHASQKALSFDELVGAIEHVGRGLMGDEGRPSV